MVSVIPARREDDTGLLRSRLFLFLTILFVFCIAVLVNGYKCFRADHLTQIPLLQMQNDPTLFPRDWFLRNYGHFDLRKYHLALLHG
jgi:hypothetical protein